MKKLGTIALTLVAILFFSWGIESHLRIMAHSNIDYPLNFYNVIIRLGSIKTTTGTITEINEETNYIQITDKDGENWTAEVIDTEGMKVGDKCKIKFDTLGNTDPYDDELIDFKF